MAFPTNSTVLDDFNRANGAIGSNWTSNPFGFGSDAAIIESNEIRSPAGGTDWSEGYYNVSSPGPDFEVYAHITVKPGTNEILGVHWIHPTGIGGAGVDGYSSYLNVQSGNDLLSLQRITNQTWTDLGATPVAQEFTAGWWLGIERIGTTIAGWYFNGSIWVQYTSATDATHTGTGRLAFDIQGTTARINEIRGGTVIPAVGTLDQLTHQWREDDGSESGASGIGSPGDNLVRPILSPVRARIQLNATGNPDAIVPLKEYRVKRASKADPWRTVI